MSRSTRESLPSWAAGLILIVGCGSAHHRAEPAPDDPCAADEVRSTPVPSLFGLRLGASLEDLRADVVGVEQEPTPSEGPGLAHGHVQISGQLAEVRLELWRGRLAAARVILVGGAVGVATFGRLEEEIAEALGPGLRSRCESEDGVPFDRFLADGWGSLSVEWPEGPVRARLRLSQLGGSPEPQIDLSLEHAALYREYLRSLPEDEGLVRGVIGGAGKEERAGCTVDLSSDEPASFLGVRYGASIDDVVAVQGGALDSSRLTVSREVAGVPSTVVFGFYSGCLATVLVLVEETDDPERAYRALGRLASEAAPEAVRRRCESERRDGPPETSLDTLWLGTSPLDGHLTQGWSEDVAVSLELSYVPLRPYAPRYDF